MSGGEEDRQARAIRLPNGDVYVKVNRLTVFTKDPEAVITMLSAAILKLARGEVTLTQGDLDAAAHQNLVAEFVETEGPRHEHYVKLAVKEEDYG